jgi:hypothetical protein
MPEIEYEPRVIGAQPVDREKIPFFTIGEDTYYVPKVIPQNIAIKALEVFRSEGEYAIASWLCEEVLGEDAYLALRDCEDITPEDLDWLFTELSKRALGPMEKALGKRKNGR